MNELALVGQPELSLTISPVECVPKERVQDSAGECCLWCHGPFLTKGKAGCCSPRCYTARWRFHNRESLLAKKREYGRKKQEEFNAVPKFCAHCAGRIKARDGNGPQRFKYCSERCRALARSARLSPRAAPKRREAYRRMKDRAYALLGGYKCVGYKINCEETREPCLGIDHIHGDGSKERRANRSGISQYKRVIKNPSRYQVLCHNCNWMKRHDLGEANPRKH